MSGNEFIITENKGDRRSITLRGRSMPDVGDEGVEFGVTQRGRVNYPPWQPVADVSVLGTVWEPLSISGLWDDKYMDQRNAPLLSGFRGLGGASGRARNCAEIIDAFYLLIRTGETLKVEWGPMTRFGLLWVFKPRFKRIERVPWEMEFNWTGDTDIKPVIKARAKISPLGLLALLLAILERIRRALQILQGPAKYFAANILQPFNLLVSAITDVLSELQKVIAGAITPRKVLGDLRAGFAKIRLAAADLLRALRNKVGFTDPLNSRDAALADYGLLFMRKEVLAVSAAMAERELELAKLDVPDLIDSTFTGDGETLRDIAKRFYGSAADWVVIANYNSLASSTVPTNTLILIPSKVKPA